MADKKKGAKKPMAKKAMKSTRGGGGISEQGLAAITEHRPFNPPPGTHPPAGVGQG